jgi:inward rectifier potassium channel
MKEQLKSTNLGRFHVAKRGVPSGFHDLYYAAMEMSWPRFICSACTIFLVTNLFFGAVFVCLPGGLLNAKPGSFLDAFFFSVETLATVGYGNMAPATYTAHALATIEIMCGLLLLATVTGLTFARFSRPRPSLLFSKVAIVGKHEGEEALIVRVASLRSQPIAQVSAQMGHVEKFETADGRVSRRINDLPLVRSQNPMLTMSWTITHVLDPDGPLNTALRSGQEARILVAVSGLDTLLATPTFSGRFYLESEILLDHEFEDMIAELGDGLFEVDVAKVHQTRPLHA